MEGKAMMLIEINRVASTILRMVDLKHFRSLEYDHMSLNDSLNRLIQHSISFRPSVSPKDINKAIFAQLKIDGPDDLELEIELTHLSMELSRLLMMYDNC